MAYGYKFLLLYALVFLFLQLQAQQGAPNFVRYMSADGLPSVETYQLLQDLNGYIWVATDRGVARIDGNREILTFTTQNGLYEDAVYGMHEDKYGRLWFFGYSGRLCYQEAGKIIRPAFNDTLKKILNTSIIKYLISDDSGTLYAGSNRPPYLLKIDKHGTIKVIQKNDKGIHLYDKTGVPFYYGQSDISKNTLDGVSVTVFGTSETNNLKYLLPVIYTDHGKSMAVKYSRGGYFIAVGDYLFYIDTLNRIKYREVGGSATISLYEDKDANIWMGTQRKGVFCFKGGDLNQTPLQYLINHSVSSVYQDYEYGYWFTTLDAGVFYTPDIQLITFERQAEALSSVTSVTWGGNDLLVNTKGNILYRVRKEAAGWKINQSKKINSPHVFDDGSNQLLFTRHKAFNVDDKLYTNVYLIKSQNYLYHNNGRQASIFIDSVFLKTDRIKINHSYSITSDLPAGLWLNCATIFNNHTYVGASSGLYCIDSAGRTQCLNTKNKELEVRINDLCVVNDSVLLAATVGNGLLLINKNFSVRSLLKSPDGLPSNTCNVICCENDSVFWVGTNAGLCRIVFDKSLNIASIRNITPDDGLASNYVVSMGIAGDKIAVGTDQGFSIWHNKPVRKPLKPVQTAIKQILVDNHPWPGDDFLELNYKENNITINYTCNQYKKAGHHLYRYRLIGSQSKWVYTRNTSVSLYSLPPGNYTFEVQAQSADASWLSITDAVHLKIMPPWWDTWSAKIATITFFLLTVSGGWIWYIRRQRLRHEQRLKLDHFKNLALKNQMNPHFIFNSLSSVQNYILSNNLRDSVRYIAKFARLMRLNLENSRKTLILLDDELSALSLYLELEKNRNGECFEYNIELSETVNRMKWKLPPMLLQPYIENAILHGLIPKGQNGQLWIRVEEKNRRLVCIIEDNGVGRVEAGKMKLTEKKSVAMNITANRIRLIRKLYDAHIHVTIEDLYGGEIACGTRVTVNIPIIKFNKNDDEGSYN